MQTDADYRQEKKLATKDNITPVQAGVETEGKRDHPPARPRPPSRESEPECYALEMNATRVTQHINAPRESVYRALLDPKAISIWKVPDGMRCSVHAFDARVGGELRISLTYETLRVTGKTTTSTDTYHGRFVELVPNERVVEIDEFETDDPGLRGEMRITIELADRNGGTEVVGLHEGLPPKLCPADNEMGWQMALKKLARFVTAEQQTN